MGELLLGLVFLIGCSSNHKENTYDSVISEFQKDGFNGNVLVAQNGEIVYQSSFGISDIEPIDSLTINAQFRLASVSKQFTAMCILSLVAEGKLEIDDSLTKYIPELPYEGITIRNLLNHTSGIPDYERLLIDKWRTDLAINNRDRFISGNNTIIDMLIEYAPEISFPPGDEWEYSNTGYVLLASIVKRVSGLSFPEYLDQYVFTPAGLKNTLVFDPVNGSEMNQQVRGLRIVNGEYKYNDIHFLNPVQGDGGIYSTLGDLFLWNEFLYNQTIIPDSLLQLAYTPGKLNNGEETSYGFGWGIGVAPDGSKVLSHSGGWVGFSTFIYRDIEHQHCIIILTSNGSSEVRDVLSNLKLIMYE